MEQYQLDGLLQNAERKRDTGKYDEAEAIYEQLSVCEYPDYAGAAWLGLGELQLIKLHHQYEQMQANEQAIIISSFKCFAAAKKIFENQADALESKVMNIAYNHITAYANQILEISGDIKKRGDFGSVAGNFISNLVFSRLLGSKVDGGTLLVATMIDYSNTKRTIRNYTNAFVDTIQKLRNITVSFVTHNTRGKQEFIECVNKIQTDIENYLLKKKQKTTPIQNKATNAATSPAPSQKDVTKMITSSTASPKAVAKKNVATSIEKPKEAEEYLSKYFSKFLIFGSIIAVLIALFYYAVVMR